jgi:Protein of unknown function (DUF3575)
VSVHRAIIRYLSAVRALAFSVVALGVAIAPSSARADDYPVWFVPEGEPMKSIAIEANPLAIAIGRFSMNLEYMVAPHHAVEISPYVFFAVPGANSEVDAYGGEIGYRYYTGKYGPEGWFLGGSLAFGTFTYQHNAPTVTRASDGLLLDGSVNTEYDSLGGAIDAGYQIILQEHVVVGLGAGVEYRYLTIGPDFQPYDHTSQWLLYGPGFRPRLLFSMGGAL